MSRANIRFAPAHDRLDAYLSAWVAALDETDRLPMGSPPDDVIWVPRTGSPVYQIPSLPDQPERSPARKPVLQTAEHLAKECSGALVAQEYDGEKQLWLDLDPDGEDALMQLQGASIRYRIAVGPIAGHKTLRLHTPGAARERAEQPKPFTAERGGFSLNAAVA